MALNLQAKRKRDPLKATYFTKEASAQAAVGSYLQWRVIGPFEN